MAGAIQLAAKDPETTTFTATIVSVDGSNIELDQTYFFAESGGQPSDRGTIGGVKVTDVRQEGERIIHELEYPEAVQSGDQVTGRIDPKFRTYCRRAHTASHVVYGAARDEVSELGYGGFEIDSEKVRIDLEGNERISQETVERIERTANECVWEGRPVRWGQWGVDEATAHSEVAFNVATQEGVFSANDRVRIVEIPGWDIAACGGTHVRNTSVIGPIRMLDRSNPGEGQTRIEFAVGSEAIGSISAVTRDAHRAAQELDVTPGKLRPAVESLQSRLTDQQTRVAELEAKLVKNELETAAKSPLTIDGATWTVCSVPDIDSDVIIKSLREVRAEHDMTGVIAVTGEDRSSITIVTSGAADASDLVQAVTARLGGGGGGGPEIAQGGGIPHDPTAVVNELKDLIAK